MNKTIELLKLMNWKDFNVFSWGIQVTGWIIILMGIIENSKSIMLIALAIFIGQLTFSIYYKYIIKYRYDSIVEQMNHDIPKKGE